MIHIKWEEDPEALLRCLISHCSPDGHLKYRYIALSYTGDSQIALCLIECKGKTIKIASNCFNALRAIRKLFRGQSAWTDSIYIDQNSLDDRSHQVALMGNIYRQAELVMIWLGNENPKIIKALLQLHKFATAGVEVAKEDKAGIQLVRECVRKYNRGRNIELTINLCKCA
jgi:hypothetical protein